MEKNNIGEYLDFLIDEKGIKTDMKITLTNLTLAKAIAGLILAGTVIALVAHALKNRIPGKNQTAQTQLLTDIKNHLQA